MSRRPPDPGLASQLVCVSRRQPSAKSCVAGPVPVLTSGRPIVRRLHARSGGEVGPYSRPFVGYHGDRTADLGRQVVGRKSNHHFVPQFYLRRFSADDRRVKAWLIERDRLVDGASIKGQCSKEYLYGEAPVLEDMLSVLESTFAQAFRRVTSDKKRELTVADRRDLLLFAVVQSNRTAVAKELGDAAADAMIKFLMRRQPEMCPIPVDGLDLVRLQSSNWARGTVYALTQFPITWNLRIRLLVNRSPVPLVLSDNPVCIQNAFLEGMGLRSQRGLHSSGIQLIFPLGPRHAVLVYDPYVYRVGCSSRVVLHKTDVRKLNDLAYLNGRNAVYVPPSMESSDLEALVRRNRRLFRPPTARVDEVDRPLPPGHPASAPPLQTDPLRARTITWFPDRFEARTFSFMQIRPELRGCRPDDRGMYVRDEVASWWLNHLLEEQGMLEDIQEGRGTIGDVWDAFGELARSGVLDAPW